jgi:phosphatidylinositol glycan class M
VYESYLYHLHRLDHRHNFSPYFYLTYLTYPVRGGATTLGGGLWARIVRSPLASFVPQMGLTLGTGLLFGRRAQDLPFAWFVQTVVFVLFNKVCTSQVRFQILSTRHPLLTRVFVLPLPTYSL